MIGPFSPPIPRRSRSRIVRNTARKVARRRLKYPVKGRRQKRRVWKRSTTYYYIDPKKAKIEAQKNRKIPRYNTKKRQVMTRVRQRILRDFIYGKPAPVASRKKGLVGRVLGKRSQTENISLLYKVFIEFGKLTGAVVASDSDKGFVEQLNRFSKMMKTFERIVRKMHIMRMLPWRRKPKRKLNVSLEW